MHAVLDANTVYETVWQARNIDRLVHGWRSAANASSVTLLAGVGS